MKIATILALMTALAGFSLTSCGSAPAPAPTPTPSIDVPSFSK